MIDGDTHLDMDALEELKLVMGDDFSLLVDTFLTDSDARIASIQAAVQALDSEEIRCSAHSFKGSASNLGAIRLTALCRQLEEMGRDKRLDGVSDVLDAIIVEFDQVRQQLRAL